MTITFQPEGKTIEIQPEQTILAAAHQAGVELVGPAGANGVGKDEPPDVTDTPGVRYAVTESDFW